MYVYIYNTESIIIPNILDSLTPYEIINQTVDFEHCITLLFNGFGLKLMEENTHPSTGSPVSGQFSLLGIDVS